MESDATLTLDMGMVCRGGGRGGADCVAVGGGDGGARREEQWSTRGSCGRSGSVDLDGPTPVTSVAPDAGSHAPRTATRPRGMAEIRKYAMSNQPPDIAQILLEAQNRWLRPTEICQILSNHKKFSIAPEPPNRPPSGSLFLFDRKILRYFRKDGHNWRKKKDGKTVKEAHEKLKVGSVDVLHCYYAHGEDNENFQRRTYWLLEEGFTNIVLVHYLEIKETTISAYAIFLLNKDIEQLLNYIGAESLGPRHELTNLKQLTTIIQSQQYISTD